MNKQTFLYAGIAAAALIGIVLLARRQTAIVQSPQIGQIGTAPGPDTTGAELAFKANIFGKYTDYLKAKDANALNLERARISSQTQMAGLQTGLEQTRLRETGQTDRTRILAENKQYADAAKYDVERRRENTDRIGQILRAIMGALGSMSGRGASGGSGSGSPTYPSPTSPQYPSRPSRPSTGQGSGSYGWPYGTPPFALPSGYSGPLFPGGYVPLVEPSAYTFFDGIGDWFDDWYDPWFTNDPPTRDESEDPVITFEDPEYA